MPLYQYKEHPRFVSDRQPVLSLEDFGHLVSTAFDNQSFPLTLSPNSQSSPSISSGPDNAYSSPSLYSTSSYSPPQRKRSRVSMKLNWFGQSSNSNSASQAPGSGLLAPLPPLPSSSRPPFLPAWAPSSTMAVLGTLKKKLSFERVPTRRRLVARSSPLVPSDVSNVQEMPRPAPFFYAQNSPLSETSNLPEIHDADQSGGSVNSVEIRSWKQKAKAKKKQSSKSLRELFRLGSSSKSDASRETPPLPALSPDPYHFLNSDVDPFAAPSPPLPSRPCKYAPIVTAHPLSPQSDLSFLDSDPDAAKFESSFDQSLSTPNQSFSPPRVKIGQSDGTDPPLDLLAFKPAQMSPIQTPNAWILDSDLENTSSIVPSLMTTVNDTNASTKRTVSPMSQKQSIPTRSCPSFTKSRSQSHSSRSNSSSSHAPSQTYSYHTAPSNSAPPSAPGSSSSSPSPVTTHSHHDISMPPPSSFKLSTPPKRRLPHSSEVHKSSRPKATIPGIWTKGSITATDLDFLDQCASKPHTSSSSRSSHDGVDRDDKSSNDGSWETAYTRPPKGPERQSSRSFELPIPSHGIEDAPKVVNHENDSQPKDHEPDSSLLALDSFTTAASPIVWPLPPKLTVLVDKKTGKKWRNVSPAKEYLQRGSPPLDPTSRHIIRYEKISLSTHSLPQNTTSKFSYPDTPNTAPAYFGQKGSLSSSSQISYMKPLPPRPGSNSTTNSSTPSLHRSKASSSQSMSSRARSRSQSIWDSVHLFLGGQPLSITGPSEMPTIFILSNGEEEELRFETRDWHQLTAFCERFKNVTICTHMGRRDVKKRLLFISVMEVRSKLILRLSLDDTIMIGRNIRPVMKSTLPLPTTLGQVALEYRKVPLGQGFYI